jgi:hypothetical protein
MFDLAFGTVEIGESNWLNPAPIWGGSLKATPNWDDLCPSTQKARADGARWDVPSQTYANLGWVGEGREARHRRNRVIADIARHRKGKTGIPLGWIL